MIYKRAGSIKQFLKIAIDFNASLEDSIQENFRNQGTIKDLEVLTNEVLKLYDTELEGYEKPLKEFNYENIQAFVIDNILKKYELTGPVEESKDIERIKNNPVLLETMISDSLETILNPKSNSDFITLLVGDIIDLYRGSQRYSESFESANQSHLM